MDERYLPELPPCGCWMHIKGQNDSTHSAYSAYLSIHEKDTVKKIRKMIKSMLVQLFNETSEFAMYAPTGNPIDDNSKENLKELLHNPTDKVLRLNIKIKS